MHIQAVTIRNFRMHLETTISMDSSTTLIVGRNNSGKTSITELFRRFLVEGRSHASFTLDDFSLIQHASLLSAARSGQVGIDQRVEPPSIELELDISYEDSVDDFAALSEFVVDLDESCTSTKVVLRYGLRRDARGEQFYDVLPDDVQEALDAVDRRIQDTFVVTAEAVDPTDSTNRADRSLTQIADRLLVGFVDAARPMEGEHRREPNTLGKLLADLFDANWSENEDDGPAAAIEKGVLEAERMINKTFGDHLKGDILPPLAPLGYPLLSDGELATRTTFEARQILKRNTKLFYAQSDSHAAELARPLPEGYNGLGLRNLIYIFLQLHALHESRRAALIPPPLCILFLEEPEAHLHPQLEEIFIRKIQQVHDRLCQDNRWPLQIVVTTHSSHIANEVPFSQIRYFLRRQDSSTGEIRAEVRDLGAFSEDEATKSWLTQYLTLTRCDLFFADKAILIEGTAERLLLPAFLRRLDREDKKVDSQPLSAQYLTVVEVGGAFAHRFFGLLAFIGVPALVVTDIDAIDDGRKKCVVAKGSSSSNACLNTWFNNPSLRNLAEAANSSKIRVDGCPIRLAYQIVEEEGGPCGRSFEEAIILANRKKWPRPEGLSTNAELEDWAGEKAAAQSKTTFALALIEAVSQNDFDIPRYLKEGLEWLREAKTSGSRDDVGGLHQDGGQSTDSTLVQESFREGEDA